MADDVAESVEVSHLMKSYVANPPFTTRFPEPHRAPQMLPELLNGSADVARHWLALLSWEDRKSLSVVNRPAAHSRFRHSVVQRGVWRLPYPREWCVSDEDDQDIAKAESLVLDWPQYEAETYLGGMDAAAKSCIRAVSVPRSALFAHLKQHLPGVEGVRVWHFSGQVAGMQKISALERRRVYQRLREVDCHDLQPLAATGVTKLAFCHASMANIADLAAFTQLTTLDLSHADVDRDASDFQCLASLTRLQHLNLERTGLSDLGFLEGLTQLQSLLISGAAIPSLAGLEAAPTLTTLDISNVWLDHERVPLSELPQLRHLRAERLGAMNPLHIELNAPHLISCSFRYCWLQHRDFLNACSNLEDLDLRDTILFEESRFLALPSLKTLQLSSKPTALRSFDWSAASELRALHLGPWDPAFVTTETIDGSFFSMLQHLETLEIAKLTKYSALPLSSLRVSSLRVHQIEMSDASRICRHLENNQQLKRLHLLAGRAVKLQLAPPRRLDTLHELVIVNVTLHDLDILRNFTGLRSLEISGVGTIPSSHSVGFFASLQHLKSLRICLNTAFEDVSPLTVLRKLEKLSLRHTNVRDVSPLVEMKTLEVLELGYTQVTDVTPLRSLKRLQRVTLPGAVSDCSMFHDVHTFPMLRSVVHEQVSGAYDCLLSGHSAIKPW